VSRAASRSPLALTLGEPAGVGPDITIEAWLARSAADVPPFIFVGDAALLTRRATSLGRDIRTKTVEVGAAVATFPDALPCLEGAPAVSGTPGTIAPSDTPAVVWSIRRAAELVRDGVASATVTNPVQKKALGAIGFPYPGHTEYLGVLAQELFAKSASPVMMLAGPDLKVVPVTIHIPLVEVARRLTSDLIVRTAIVVARDLARRFSIPNPRLAVAGLNPHAGEAGMLGREDETIVRPAVEALRRTGIEATGPLPADTMFHPEARQTYDAALCMYHDQALIPIKAIAFDKAVNVTLGLPFVRTSPDHGTALAIAGSGKAHATSLIEALKLARSMSCREAAV
jgi:4-hydroxythreonine-4-phosphate dehydrogenase